MKLNVNKVNISNCSQMLCCQNKNDSAMYLAASPTPAANSVLPNNAENAKQVIPVLTRKCFTWGPPKIHWRTSVGKWMSKKMDTHLRMKELTCVRIPPSNYPECYDRSWKHYQSHQRHIEDTGNKRALFLHYTAWQFASNWCPLRARMFTKHNYS